MADLPYSTDNPLVPPLISPELTITVGDIPITDEDGQYNEQVMGNGKMFPDYIVESRFEKNPRKYMMGVTSPNGFQGSSVSFVQLAAPTLLWICDWSALKINDQPEIPNPESKNPNWVLLWESVEPAMLDVMPDGVSPAYRISGTYVYGSKSPKGNIFNDVYFPLPPYLQDNFDRAMPTQKLMDNIAMPQGGGNGGAFPGNPGDIGRV